MIKHLVFLLLSTFSLSINAQVKIDVVGDNWEQVVHNALTLIKETDSTTYKFVTSNCNHIGFWNGNYSTTEGKSIFLTTTEVRNGNINNIACAIVHESKHIELSNRNLSESQEECICYFYELEFILKMKNTPLRQSIALTPPILSLILFLKNQIVYSVSLMQQKMEFGSGIFKPTMFGTQIV